MRRTVIGSWLLGLAFACGSGKTAAPDSVLKCVPGSTASCACTDGRTGAQLCQPEGIYIGCVCSGHAGSSGNGGSSGSGGDAPAGSGGSLVGGPAGSASVAGGGGVAGDAGGAGEAGAASGLCTSDFACSDGLFCTGIERCAPRSELADARGCVPGHRPCIASECDESRFICVAACVFPSPSALRPNAVAPSPKGAPAPAAARRRPLSRASACVDADADGECSIESGGSDCNDADADEYPGHRELCDLHDEDCDPSTLGPDEDGDGFVSDACCNPQPGGGTLCGSDCDDANPRVSPLAVEICDGIDNDCNGAVDDGVNVKLYADVDGDGLGNPDCEAALCPGTPGFVGNSFDCDDTTRAQTLCSPSAEGQVLLCESGVWTVADCPFGTTCISQPDGSGVCQR